jgi:hypothetical protein
LLDGTLKKVVGVKPKPNAEKRRDRRRTLRHLRCGRWYVGGFASCKRRPYSGFHLSKSAVHPERKSGGVLVGYGLQQSAEDAHPRQNGD